MREERFITQLESFLKLRVVCDEHYELAQARDERPASFILNVLEDRRLTRDEKVHLLEIVLRSCHIVVEHL